LLVANPPTSDGSPQHKKSSHHWLENREGHPQCPALPEGALVPSGQGAVACGDDGLPAFDRLRYRRQDGAVFLFAFDLLELDGRDLRREPLEVRKATLASLLRRIGAGVQLNEHLAHEDGEVVFRHACKLGLEGIVSKRLNSVYRSGRSRD
jgi:bifunctional non-homologous end joining protein LigD